MIFMKDKIIAILSFHVQAYELYPPDKMLKVNICLKNAFIVTVYFQGYVQNNSKATELRVIISHKLIIALVNAVNRGYCKYPLKRLFAKL